MFPSSIVLLALPILGAFAGVLPRQATSPLQGGKVFTLTNAKSGTVLDLCATCDDGSVIGYTPKGGENQQWRLEWADKGWTFQSVSTGGYLTHKPQEPGNGANITAVAVSSTEPTIWHIWHDEDTPGAYRVFVPYTHQVLDLFANGNPEPGTPVTLWYTWPNKHQAWYFNEVNATQS